uniref:Uncharacterized protein n=1 Tax=Anguilla anguilla TaxID=7936 RepID=A0A0E9SHG1_ANGAN
MGIIGFSNINGSR